MWSESLEKQRNIELWTSRKHSGMDHSKEAWDIRSEKWVKQISESEEAKKRSHQRVKQTALFLRERGLLGPDSSVIDIGCGPGRFVCEFAQSAKHVVGTDISPEMCRFGKVFAKELGIENVEFIEQDFNTADIDELGWRKNFDLVFSSITPAMSAYESMRKAEAMSRKYCFQSNYVKVNDPLADEIFIRVLEPDQMPEERGFQTFLPLFNILCLEGKYPEINFYDEEACDKVPADENLVQQLMKNAHVEMTSELEKKVLDILKSKADAQGLAEHRVKWTYGWILWDVTGQCMKLFDRR